MSTRCQIKIEGHEPMIYKHHDGYPEGVLPILKPTVKAFMLDRGNEPDYLLAQIIRRFAIGEAIAFASNKHPHALNPLDSNTGWGVDCIEHGDIDYLYTITEDGKILVNGEEVGHE